MCTYVSDLFTLIIFIIEHASMHFVPLHLISVKTLPRGKLIDIAFWVPL